MTGINNFMMQNNYNMMRSLYGNSGLGGLSNKYNVADKNMAKLESIIARRTEQETQINEALLSYKKDTTSFYADFYPAMKDLKDSASKLKNTSFNSAMRPMGYGSNDSSVVADVSGNVDGKNQEITIDVAQIATGQSNAYNAVDAAAKGAFDGAGKIELSIGGKSQSFDFNIKAGATNKDALNEIAKKLNDSKAGITAKVVTEKGQSSLQLVADKTGTSSEFSVKMSGALATMGDAAITKGQNAVYTIDSKEMTSESNKITFAEGKLSANLTGKGKATIAKKNVDSNSVYNAVQQFAKDYNDSIDMLNKHSSKGTSIKNLASSFGNTRFQTESLSSMGISVDYNGKLSVSESAFKGAYEKDPAKVQQAIGDRNGLAGAAYQKASSAIINSTRMVDNPQSSKFNRFYGSSIGLLLDTKI